MFEQRELPDDLAAVRATHAPDAVVLETDRDFETLDPAAAEDLGLLVDSLSPASYPNEWLPEDAPELLRQYASGTFTVGMPGDGTVTWTRQTDPPVLIVKGRAEGAPEDFIDFLVAEALVEVGLEEAGVEEQFLPFFGERYIDLDAAVDLGPTDTYQIAAALYDGWVGLHTRECFASWAGQHERLHEAWLDAGSRLEGRLADLPGEVARGETAFPAATELACSALKHDVEPPTPFAALDTSAYEEYGARYAVRWAEKTFEKLRE